MGGCHNFLVPCYAPGSRLFCLLLFRSVEQFIMTFTPKLTPSAWLEKIGLLNISKFSIISCSNTFVNYYFYPKNRNRLIQKPGERNRPNNSIHTCTAFLVPAVKAYDAKFSAGYPQYLPVRPVAFSFYRRESPPRRFLH